jgi:hypothetical protein
MRLIRTSVVTVFLLATAGLVWTVHAQSDGNPVILQAVQALQSSVDAIASQLTALQTSVNALSAPNQTNIRFTPPLIVSSSNVAACFSVNITDVTRTVQIQVLSDSGTVIDDSGNVTLAAGHTWIISVFGSSLGETVYCKFTVVDGSRADIRAALGIFSAPGDPTFKLSVPAE